jgi:hypothetical protein
MVLQAKNGSIGPTIFSFAAGTLSLPRILRGSPPPIHESAGPMAKRQIGEWAGQ